MTRFAAPNGRLMSPSLHGHSILVVEDEPLIALDIVESLESAGAAVTMTNTLSHALILVEHEGLSGAVLDHALGHDDSASLCSRLKQRGVPFMIYSGFKTVGGECGNAPHLEKPATEGQLVTAMASLIFGQASQCPNCPDAR
jgi:CheY-like chemotaxis protein